MNDKNIKFTQSGKHLGLNDSSGQQFYSIDEVIRDIKVKSNVVSFRLWKSAGENAADLFWNCLLELIML